MLMIAPQGLIPHRGQKQEKIYCEITTKPATSFSFHDPSNLTNGRNHNDIIGSELPHFVNERLVHEIRTPDTQVQNMDLLHDGIVEGVQEPGCVTHLNINGIPVKK